MPVSPDERLRISYYPAQDQNPQYWGRVYPAGETAHLFGRPVLLPAAETGAAPYLQLNNLILTGDLSGLTEYLQSNPGYLHVWGAGAGAGRGAPAAGQRLGAVR